ncbi:MAG TPA: hypothetical protein VMD47_08985 [Candidatus Acidoferrales bacterium]|nr:hypothetical protein [Candidatus Acidoferrales bacterium]
MVDLGAGFLAAFVAGLVDFMDDFVDFIDFIEPFIDELVDAFADAFGFGDAAIAGTVIRNAAARNIARVFFTDTPPSVARYGNVYGACEAPRRSSVTLLRT